MKIAIVCYPTFGGSGVVATELGLELAQKGHEIHFITYKQPVRLSLLNPNIYFHEVNVPNYPLFHYQPYELALSSKLVDMVKLHKIDVLHVHYAIPHAYGLVGHRQPGQGGGGPSGPEHEPDVRARGNSRPMPTPAVTLKLKRFRRRFGISAPRVVVRSHVPWQWIALPAGLLALLLGAAGWLVAQRDEAGQLGEEADRLRQQLTVQREELEMLRATAGTGKNAVNIERAAQQRLLSRIQSREAENAGLKQDILLFERLIPVAGEGASVRVENFRVFKESPKQYRYRLLVAYQPDKQSSEFKGRLEILVSYASGGRAGQLQLPGKRDGAGDYLLQVKHFLRREGSFQLPSGAVLQGVEARIMLGDTLKSRQLAQF